MDAQNEFVPNCRMLAAAVFLAVIAVFMGDHAIGDLIDPSATKIAQTSALAEPATKGCLTNSWFSG